ncbi:MAG: hypothetical protein ABFD16_19320, partial [Thermoguttaceae bacterium]
MRCRVLTALLSCFVMAGHAVAEPAPTVQPLVRVVDLKVGESQEVELPNGKKVVVKLLGVKDRRDSLRDAVRKAE